MTHVAAPYGPTAETPRVADLRRRVREAMDRPPEVWQCPAAIDGAHLAEPLPAIAIAELLVERLQVSPPRRVEVDGGEIGRNGILGGQQRGHGAPRA